MLEQLSRSGSICGGCGPLSSSSILRFVQYSSICSSWCLELLSDYYEQEVYTLLPSIFFGGIFAWFNIAYRINKREWISLYINKIPSKKSNWFARKTIMHFTKHSCNQWSSPTEFFLWINGLLNTTLFNMYLCVETYQHWACFTVINYLYIVLTTV